MERKKRVGIWIRVSTDKQVEDESPEHHELRARMYIEAKGWEITEVYRLVGISGKSTFDLPITKKMLHDLHTGRIEALVFSKLARLGRNTKELLEFSEVFQKEKGDLISLAESIDTSSPAGRMFFTVIAAIAQWEREEIASRVAASVPVRAALGKPLGGAAPFGYKWKGEKESKHKELVIDETEAPIRKLLHESFAQEKRKKTVAAILNNKGYRTRNGSKFTNTTIGRLLRDTTAKGVRVANYTKSLGEGKKWEYKPESEWVLSPCPAIITADLWDECNKILDQQEKKRKPAKKTTKLFTGLLFCSCGGRMNIPSKGTKYQCEKCGKTKIAKDDLEEIYYENLRSFLLSDNDIEKFLLRADSAIEEKENQLKILSSEKKRLQSEMDKIMKLYIDNQIEKENFGKHYNPLNEQLRQIEKSVPETEAERDFMKMEYLNSDTIIYEAKNLYDRWKTLDDSGKRSIVEQITDQITIGGDEISIRFSYNPAFFRNAPDGERNYIPAFPFGVVQQSARLDVQCVENPQSLGEHLKNKQFELKISQNEMARRMGTNPENIISWCHERTKPPIGFYPKIIQFLGYNPFPIDTGSIGGQIKKYRMEQGLSHRKLARITGFDPATLARWEENITAPNVENKMKLVVMDVVK